MKGVLWRSLLLCASVGAGMCAACKADSETKDAPVAASDDDDGGGASPFGLPPMAEMFAKGLEKPGPYEPRTRSEKFDATAPHFVVLEIDKPLSELQSYDLLAAAGTTPMRSFRKKLREAASNEHVKGVLLRMSRVPISMSVAQDLRAALEEFKEDGKHTVACHTEGVSNGAYFALMACDKIGLAPLGDISIPGPSASPVHVRGLLDRVGVQADFLHIGDFKGAAEPLTRDAPSEQMKETLGAILDQSYATMVDGIAQGRKLQTDDVKGAIDRAMFTGEQAKTASLVDEIATFEDFRASVVGEVGWTRPSKDDANPLKQLARLQRFLGMMPTPAPTEPHVALVYAVGNIVDGGGNGILGARDQVASRTLVPALRALARDESVAAVVMRVDSPGGSALASEQIWAAARELGERKPLVVSMGSVAASGGYYISSPAKKIYARENTLTGSIGVVGGKMVVGQALEDIGVKTYELGRGARASMWSPMRPWTDEERSGVRSMMEQVYETFLSRVASGRGIERDAVHEVAQGRVWTGVAAKERGLVDEIGGLDKALVAAAQFGGVSLDAGLQVYPPKPTLRDFLQSFGQVQSGGPLGARIVTLLSAAGALPPGATAASLPTAVAAIEGSPQLPAVVELLRRVLLLQSARIWAISWVTPPA